MRPSLVLLAALPLAVSACAPAASGALASDVQPSVVESPSAVPSTSASASPSPSPSPLRPSATASAPASPSPSPSALPVSLIDPAVIGGPAPVGSFVLGDSIILSSRVAPVLAAYGYPVVGLVGQGAGEWYLRTHLSSPEAQAAPAWVIELGTNNSGDAGTIAQVGGWIDLVDSLRTPGAKQQVLWVTPHRPEAYSGGQGTDLDALNTELSRQAGEHRWLRMLDFDLLAKQHPEWFEADAMRLHPNEEGQAALVALIAGDDPVVAPEPAPVVNASRSAEPTAAPASPDPVFDNSAG